MHQINQKIKGYTDVLTACLVDERVVRYKRLKVKKRRKIVEKKTCLG